MKDKKEETEEKPKAVVEMEENSDAGKAKKRIKEKKEQNAKIANKKFIIKYIVFVIICALITVGAIYYSIMKSNKDEEKTITEEKIATKPVAEDTKYAINSYSETYDENSIKIEYYGSNDIKNQENLSYNAEYIQISGLLDKDIQNSINNRLKETAKKLKEGNRRTYSYVMGNFGNVLSVNITNEDNKVETINIDLSTGNDIKFEDVFVSSTPLNSLIIEGVFKELAWEKLYVGYEENAGFLDMSKVDTSEYEDIALKVVNNYKSNKSNLKYCISVDGVIIYNIKDKSMISNDSTDNSIIIDFIGHRENIAIYKRFLSTKSIYENDSIGSKDTIVFTNSNESQMYIENLIYGKDDNVFVEEAFINEPDGEDINKDSEEKIKDYFSKIADEDKKNIKSQIKDSEGAFYQKEIVLLKQKQYYKVYITQVQATCNISYFNDEAFKEYAKMKNIGRADLGINMFYYEDTDVNSKLKISKTNNSEMYFDLNGNFIGSTEEEAKSKLSINNETSTTEENNLPDNQTENITERTTENTTIENSIINNIEKENKIKNETVTD